jgi:apolipoprotein N-acyltransferase
VARAAIAAEPALTALVGVLASALLFGLAARLEWPSHIAALVAFAPWFAGIDRARARVALGSAVVLSMAVVAVAFWWLPAAIVAYAHVSAPLAWISALALAPLVLQPQFLVAGSCRLLARRFGASRAAAGVLTALAYVGAEWALPKLLGDTLGIGLFPSDWLRQSAELAGPRGLTLICLAVSECVAALAAGPLIAAAAITTLASSYGFVRLRAVEATTGRSPTISAGVVQAAITAYDKLAAEQGTFETVRQILQTHIEMSEELLRAGPLDVLIWPETVYPTTFGAPKSEEGADFDHEIAALPARTGVPLVFGAFEQGSAGEHNSAFFLAADGQVETYRKSLLFPLTEQVPRWLDSPALRTALPWTGRWTSGAGPRVVPLRLRSGAVVRLEPLICYEAVHAGYVARGAHEGAEVLLTLSNDAWFTDPAAPRLHLAAAALRSVELRLPQIRATNSGISALVLPSGKIVGATSFGARVALRLAVPHAARRWTPALAWGDWLGPSAFAACVLAALYVLATAARTWLAGTPPSPNH